VTPLPSHSPEKRARRLRRGNVDTIIVPAREEGFQTVFLNQKQWYAIRISAEMKGKIKYIAAYRVAPISAVTHIAEVAEISFYKGTGKCLVAFKQSAQEIRHVPIRRGGRGPQGPVYVQRQQLLISATLDELFEGQHTVHGAQYGSVTR
jgi:hypothetical protein